MQSTSSRSWTRVAVTISLDDNHYTTDIFLSCLYVWRRANFLTWHSLYSEIDVRSGTKTHKRIKCINNINLSRILVLNQVFKILFSSHMEKQSKYSLLNKEELRQDSHTKTHIHIYVCVCVCMCVCKPPK